MITDPVFWIGAIFGIGLLVGFAVFLEAIKPSRKEQGFSGWDDAD